MKSSLATLLLLGSTVTTTNAQEDQLSYTCAAFQDGDEDITCEACLEQGCGWNEGVCVTLCDLVLQGTCHSLEDPTETRTIADICLEAYNHEQDGFLCEAITDCETCTNTIKTDGVTTCEWFNTDVIEPFCGTGGCNVGACGATTCDDPEAGMIDSQQNIQSAISEESAINNNTTEESTSDESEFVNNCQSVSGCGTCYKRPTCAWANGTCFYVGADFHLDNQTADELCAYLDRPTDTEEQDEEDYLAMIFQEVAAAIEQAREEGDSDSQENAQEGMENDNVGIPDETTTESTGDSSGEEIAVDRGNPDVAAATGVVSSVGSSLWATSGWTGILVVTQALLLYIVF